MDFLGLLILPILIAGGAALYYKEAITLKEVFLQLGIIVALMTAGYFVARHFALSSTEHLNGRISQKLHGSQKCCHCRDVCDSRDKDGKCTSSHEECNHSRDYWWSLDTTVGRIGVDDCESNEYSVPTVWARAWVGEPAAVENSYTNYLKADPESLFVHAEHLKRYQVPKYPEIYSLYKVNPVISDGPKIPEGWQAALREVNADFGDRSQVDVTVLMTQVQDPVYAQAVEAQWLYGPKNSMTVVLGVAGGSVTWARVVSISKIEPLKIELRDGLQGKKLTEDIPGMIRAQVKSKFHRTPMSDFKYLLDNADIPTGWMVVLCILGALLSFGGSVYLHQNDVFGDEGSGAFDSYGRRPFRRPFR